MVLGKNDDKRREIYDFFVKTYTLRNKIVQGSTYTFSDMAETASKF